MRSTRTATLLAVAIGAAAIASTAAATPTPSARAVAVVRMWRANLARGAAADPARRFPNPSKAILLVRLAREARSYGFQIVRVEILHPRQQAPLVVIRADDERELAKATSAILHVIDPKARTSDDRTGWAYEGFLFEALDRHGIPFLATFNWWRGPHAGGGQWAADPSLYPFPHG